MSVAQKRGNTIADFLAYGLITYIVACVFYNIGFFLTVVPSDAIPRAFVGLDTFLSLPIVPTTGFLIMFLNRLSVEVTLFVAVALAYYVIRDTFFHPRGEGGQTIGRFVGNIHPAGRMLVTVICIIAVFGLALAYIKFPDVSEGAEQIVVRSLGAILALGLALFVAFVRRTTTRYFQDAFDALAAMYLMLVFLLVGLSVGSSLHLRSPDHKIELTTGKEVIGTTVATMPAGVLFLEYVGPGPRMSTFYAIEHVASIRTIPVAERVRVPKPLLRSKSLFCEFVKSWARFNVCGAQQTAAAMVLDDQSGQFEPLPYSDPRVREARSLSELQSGDDDGAQNAGGRDRR